MWPSTEDRAYCVGRLHKEVFRLLLCGTQAMFPRHLPEILRLRIGFFGQDDLVAATNGNNLIVSKLKVTVERRVFAAPRSKVSPRS